MVDVKESLPEESGWAAVQPGAVLHVTGEDALAFLQGQFTQELRPERAPAAQYGLWLNQKGRVLADSTVVRGQERDFWLLSLECAAAVVRERLEAYVIADDVVVEDVTPGWQVLLLHGEAARQWLAGQVGALPAAGEAVAAAGGWVLRSRHAPADTLEWWTPAAPPRPTALPLAPAEAWERRRIRRGVPAVPRDVGPGDLAAEAGLDRDAISFTKGCYLGQEVVARLRSLGRVRRRLCQVEGSGAVPRPGDRLLQGGKGIGEVRSAVSDGSGGWIGLAMIALAGADPANALVLEGDDAGPVRWTLPEDVR